jgi:hypothetical protein
MMVVKNIQNRYTSFALKLTDSCSWCLNDLALRFNTYLLYRLFALLHCTDFSPSSVAYTETVQETIYVCGESFN